MFSAFNSSPVLPPCFRRSAAFFSPAYSKGLIRRGSLGSNRITILPPTKTELEGLVRPASPESPTIACAIDGKPSAIQVWSLRSSPVPRPKRTNGTPSSRGQFPDECERWTVTPSTPVARMTRQEQPRLSWRHGENRTTAKRQSRKRRSASAQTGSQDKGVMFESISCSPKVQLY